MTPKEKAQQLINNMGLYARTHNEEHYAKQCALICIKEILNSNKSSLYPNTGHAAAGYWNQVKEEINKL